MSIVSYTRYSGVLSVFDLFCLKFCKEKAQTLYYNKSDHAFYYYTPYLNWFEIKLRTNQIITVTPYKENIHQIAFTFSDYRTYTEEESRFYLSNLIDKNYDLAQELHDHAESFNTVLKLWQDFDQYILLKSAEKIVADLIKQYKKRNVSIGDYFLEKYRLTTKIFLERNNPYRISSALFAFVDKYLKYEESGSKDLNKKFKDCMDRFMTLSPEDIHSYKDATIYSLQLDNNLKDDYLHFSSFIVHNLLLNVFRNLSLFYIVPTRLNLESAIQSHAFNSVTPIELVNPFQPITV